MQQLSIRSIVVCSLGALAVLGSPLISLWLSFFVLGNIGLFAQPLQIHSAPSTALLPAFVAGALFVGLGVVQIKRGSSLLLTLGASLLVINIVAYWLFSLLIVPRFSVSQVPFDQEIWSQVDCKYDRTRARMLADLREELRGKSKEEVVATIGQPSDGKSSYCIGPEPHVIPVDRDFMQPVFNRAGQFADLRITGS